MFIGSLIILVIILLSLPSIWYGSWKYKLPVAVTMSFFLLLIFVAMVVLTPGILGNYNVALGGRSMVEKTESTSYVWFDLGFSPLYMMSLWGFFTAITSTYIHRGILHVGGNILFLLLFGVPLERKIGPKWLLIGYFTTGILASYASGSLDYILWGTYDFSPYKVYFGASAAISGIMGMYLYLYPKDEIYAPIFIVITKAPVYVGVLVFLGLETYIAFTGPTDGIGHTAHISGVLAGIAVGALMNRLGIEDRTQTIRSVSTQTQKLSTLEWGSDARRIINKINGEDNPEIIDAWLEKLAETSECPKCGGKLSASGGQLKCLGCGMKIRVYK